MNSQRSPWLLATSLCVLGAVALVYLVDSARRQSERASVTDISGSSGQDGPTDRTRLQELRTKHGGFTTIGRVMLTRPPGPGNNLEVVLTGDVDGVPVEMRTATRADGRFKIDPLPRSGTFTVSVADKRVQSFERGGLVPPDEGSFEVGDLVVNRYYFVTGRVVGESTAGIAGATVALVEATESGSFSFFEASEEAGREEAAAASIKTSPDGRFRLRIAEPGIFTFRVASEGRATHYRRDVIVGGSADVRVMAAPTHGHEVAGHVIDASGHAVADAAVVFYGAGWGSFSVPKEVTRTGDDGSFRFRVEPTARDYILSVVPKDGLDLNTRFKVPLTNDLVLRLPGGGVLSGRVVDELDEPVAGAEVLIGISKSPGAMRMPDFSRALRTNGRGVFRLEGVGKGYINTLSVRADEHADVHLGPVMSTDPELWQKVEQAKLTGAGELKLPAIRVHRGKMLKGVITDHATDRPLAGATVELWGFVMGNRTTTTAADGGYHFDSVGERVAMVASKKGYATFSESPMPGYMVSRRSKVAVRDITLVPGGAVAGTVRTPDGEPVGRALVRLRSPGSGWNNWRTELSLRDLWTYTDAGGNYRVMGVPPVKLEAEAIAPGYDRGRSKTHELANGGTADDLDIRLVPAARVEGVVLTRDGSPVASARVTVARDPGDESAAARWQALSEGVFAFTNQKGRFTLSNMPVGDLLFRAEADGFAPLVKRQRGVKPGVVLSGVMLEVTPEFRIGGRVVDGNGDAVTHCWVRAKAADGSELAARVGQDGRFLVRGAQAGSYRLTVSVTNDVPGVARYDDQTLEDVQAGTKNLVVTLQPR